MLDLNKMNPSLRRWAELKGFATREEEDLRAKEESLEKCSWEEIGNKPEVFTPDEHTHVLSEIVNYEEPDLSNYATLDDLDKVKGDLQDSIKGEVAALVNGAPETLDTLKEIGEALAEKGDAVVIIEQIGEVEAKVNSITLESLGYTAPDLSPYATKENVKEVEDAVSAISLDSLGYVEPDLTPYATKEEVSAVEESVANISLDSLGYVEPDLTPYVLKSELPLDHVTKEDLANAIEEVEAKIPDVPSDHASIEELAAAIFRINVLEDKVTALSKTNVTPVVAGVSNEVKDETADLVIAKAEAPITENVVYTGKSVEVKSMDVTSAKVKLNAVAGDLTISNYVSSGSIEGKVVEIEAYSGEHVKITNCVLSQSGYNAINIGNTKTTVDTAPKSILIDNVQLNGTMSNNAINIYGQKDNAVITISNCHFEGVSNPVRLFNVTNTACTVNFINCTCSAWEADANELMYSGFLICEDATSTNMDEEILVNRFSRDKITVNFVNCYGPYGKIESSDPATFCGTANADQLVYVFRHKTYKVETELDSNNTTAGIIKYGDGSEYPAITIK